MCDLKIYRNKKLGQFTSIPEKLTEESSQLDSLYMASHFHKLRTKPVAAIRKSKHYASTVEAWKKKLTGVDTSDLAAVAKTLGFDVEVFNPLASSEPQTFFSGGGRSKRKAQLLKVKKEVYKPMKGGAIIDELPPDMMRDVVGRLDPEDKSALLGVSRGVREDTIAALPPQTILSRAVDTGNVELLEIAIREGADVNAKNEYGSTPLHKSARHGRLEVARALIDKGADVNAKNDDGWTPLLLSASNEHLEVARFLIEAGADVNAKNEYGFTPLHKSARHGHLEVARALIDKGADVNAKNDDGSTPLLLSAENGRLEVVRALIEAGADVNAKNEYGSTPLHNTYTRHLEVSRALIEAGADLHIENNWGRTPLDKDPRLAEFQRNVRRRIGGADNSTKDDALASAIQVLFRKMSSLHLKQALVDKLNRNNPN